MQLTQFSAFELQPLPDGASTILRLLAAQAPNWPEIALVAARDPALCLALLLADPLCAGELQEGLNSALRKRLERTGADLLRAWLLGLGHLGEEADDTPDNSLLRAECALHLAIETGYPRTDEAYLAGLWRGLTGSERWRTGQRPSLPALIHDCGLPPTLADALEVRGLLDEQIAAAHPLIALIAAAERLVAQDWQDQVAQVARLTGLESASVMSLRTDVGYIVSGHAAYPPAPPTAGRPSAAQARPRLIDDPYRSAGMLGLLTAAFVDLDAATVRERLNIACPLFGLRVAPVLLGCDDRGVLHPLLTPPDGSPEALIGELGLRLDDAASCIALSARSGQPAEFTTQTQSPGRSVIDWQIARWLGHPGFQVLPLGSEEDPSVALVPTLGRQALDSEMRWRYVALLGAAARALRSHHRHAREITECENALQARFRDHMRKLAHEASNPLTVLKSRLGMLAQERSADTPLQDELSLLNAELDRIDNLLRNSADLPAQSPESRACRVPELLLDMRTLYGEPLFSSRDIQLELRAARDVPPAAIPPSALKQVLLNLFRNASEALQPGQRLIVSVLPLVNVDGRNCLEIRFVDNGPGLPPERARDPLSPRPSEKGGTHRGVGLSIVREILAKWGATLLCRSQPGTGTSFQVMIPLEEVG